MTPSANKVRLCLLPNLDSTSLTPRRACSSQVISAMAGTYVIEAFQESELLVNITQHTLVPKHEVLTMEDKKLLLTK